MKSPAMTLRHEALGLGAPTSGPSSLQSEATPEATGRRPLGKDSWGRGGAAAG